MAQSIANNREPAGPAQQLDAYLQKQMSRASGQVRLFELFSAVLLLTAGILGGLFLVALVDAWVIELRPWMRWLAFISLVAGSAAWTILVIVPLMIRRINPVYAARMVELSRPEIKNGLINYLLLRSVERSGQPVSRRVIELVGSRAAHDISGVEISETIDKSRSVRAATFLVLVLGAFAAYLFLSPKSPFQTIARVLAPAADLSRPARVRISDVKPGDAVAFFGQPVTISARVRGQFANEPVSVVYSTNDGQVINATVGMQPSESGDDEWSVVLRTDERGVGQSLTYHVQAGDGQSTTYSLIVKSTPMLTLDKIEYRFPAYTKLPDLSEKGNTEIHGLEGSNVTVFAVANSEMKQARLELLNRQGNDRYDVVGTVPLQVENKKNASGSFQLQLDNRRQAQLWSHYRLELTTVDGAKGDPGTPFPIKVIPDLPPEIQIVEPGQPEVSLPVNSRLRLFVRAQDQDFELSRILAHGTSLGVPAFEKEIPIPADADRAGQVNVSFDLVPKELALRVGETVVVNFEAIDNRTSLTSNALDPNRIRSNNIIVNIMPPSENPENMNPPEDGGEGDEKESAAGDQNPPPQQNEGEKKDESGRDANEEKSGAEGDEKSSGETGEGDDSEKKNDSKGDEGEGAGSKSDSKSGNKGQESESSAGDKSEGDKGGSGEKSGNQGQPSAADGSESGESGDSEASGKGEQGNQQGNADGSQANPDDNGNQKNAPGENAGSEEPLSQDAHPGEIIEEVNRFREQRQNKGQEQKGPENAEGTGESQAGDQSGDKSDQQNPGNQSDKNSAKGNKGEQSSSDGKPSGKDSDKSAGGDETGKNADGSKKQGGGDKKDSSSAAQQQDGDKNNQGNPSQGKDEGSSGQNDESSSAGGKGEDKTGSEKEGDKSAGGGDQSEEKDEEKKKDQKAGDKSGQGNKPEETSGGESPGSSGDQKGDSAGGQGGEKSGDPSASKQGNKGGGEPSSEGGEKPGGDPSSQKGNQPSAGGKKGPGDEPGSKQGDPGEGEGNKAPAEGQGKQPEGPPGGSGGEKGDGKGESGESSSEGGNSSGPSPSGDQSGSAGAPGAGGSGSAKQDKQGFTGGDVGADEANLEYTKKATDLALDYLEGQQDDPDPELLERLNWSEEELREFVQRWRELKSRAETGSEEDKRQLEQELRSLGLTRPQTAAGEQEIERDKQAGYREEGRVSNAPPGFKAFQRRRNRSGEEKK